MPIQLIYWNEDIVVVHKPPMIGVHSTDRAEGVIPAVRAAMERLKLAPSGGDLHLVHRLDTPVEGVLVLARNRLAAAAWSASFAGQSVGKVYVARLLRSSPKSLREDLQGRRVCSWTGGHWSVLSSPIPRSPRDIVEAGIRCGLPASQSLSLWSAAKQGSDLQSTEWSPSSTGARKMMLSFLQAEEVNASQKQLDAFAAAALADLGRSALTVVGHWDASKCGVSEALNQFRSSEELTTLVPQAAALASAIERNESGLGGVNALLFPLSGGKHQLRVHCTMSLHRAIEGDSLYGRSTAKSSGPLYLMSLALARSPEEVFTVRTLPSWAKRR